MEIAREGTLKTQIMYKANLSFTQLNNYIAFLLTKKLLAPMIYDGREGFVVTTKGLDFLQKHSELVQLLETYGRGSSQKAAPPVQSSPKKT